MQLDRRLLLKTLFAGAGGYAGLPSARAQAQPPQGLPGGWPSRPVRVVVAAGPGGSPDLVARLMFGKLQERWGSTFVIENRPGVTVAVDAVSRSAPDGYTLLVGSNSIFFGAEQLAKVPYDVRTRFIPISQVISTPYVVTVNNDLPVQNIAELIAYAKAHPKELNYGMIAGGTASQLIGELLKLQAGIQMEAIGFKGVASAFVELMAGRVHLYSGVLSSCMPLIKTGKIRAIAVTGPQRSSILPNVATMRESLSGFDTFDSWCGLFAVDGTPREMVAALNREFNQIMNMQEVKGKLTADGSEITPGAPEQLRESLVTGLDSAKRIVQLANIRL